LQCSKEMGRFEAQWHGDPTCYQLTGQETHP
jgi:hypothetical protein